MFTGETQTLSSTVFGSNPKNPQLEFMFSKKKIVEHVGGRSYKHAESIKQSMMDLKKCETPDHGVTTLSAEGSVARMEEEMKMKSHATQTRELQCSTSKVWNTEWGKCTEHLKSRIESSDKYEKILQEANPIGLLKVMQNLQHQYSELEHCAEVVIKAEKKITF